MNHPTGSALDDVLEHGDVRTYFQPIVDLVTQDVVGYEALSRGPEGPLQAPDALFAAARDVGRLGELDRLCCRTALRSAVSAGLFAPTTVFVNIEPEVLDSAQLGELGDLAEQASGTVHVVLEVTERALAARPAELLDTSRRLRAAGWRLALDDVGADDMSLAFLSLLEPDVIKLDLSLVQRRPGPKVAEIMNAVNACAERTGAVVLAEGIEDEAHLSIALALGARLDQGWLFGRPEPMTTAPQPSAAAPLPPACHDVAAVASPFACLPMTLPLRISTKALLVQVSIYLERQALRLGSSCIVLATFQHASQFTPGTAERYRDLAQHVAFVAAIGEDLGSAPIDGVRGATLAAGDPLIHEWDLVVLAPHFAAALLAHDLGDDDSDDRQRRFRFALTYDRDTVCAAARSLMARVLPVPAGTEPAACAPAVCGDTTPLLAAPRRSEDMKHAERGVSADGSVMTGARR